MAKVVVNGHSIVCVAIRVMRHSREELQIVENVRDAVEDAMVGQDFLEPPAQDSNVGARIEEQRMAVQSNVWPFCILAWRRVIKRRTN